MSTRCLAVAVAFILLAPWLTGCKTMETVGRATWTVVRPVAMVLDPPSRLMAGHPEQDEEELAYEKAFIERARPGVGGAAAEPLREDDRLQE